MQGVINEHNIAPKDNPSTRAKDQKHSQQETRVFEYQPVTLHIEHKPSFGSNESHLCVDEIRENKLKGIGTADGGKREREGEGGSCSASSSNSLQGLENDVSMIEAEVGDVDLEDILEAERIIAVTEEEDIVGQHEHGTFVGSRHYTYTNATTITETKPNLHQPPSCEMPLPARPSNVFDTGHIEKDRQQEIPVIPKINGVEVEVIDVVLTQPEVDFYMDVIYGRWRARELSRLRRCWTPIGSVSI